MCIQTTERHDGVVTEERSEDLLRRAKRRPATAKMARGLLAARAMAIALLAVSVAPCAGITKNDGIVKIDELLA